MNRPQYDESRTEHLGGMRPVAFLDVGERATFLARTYTHLLGAIVAFTLLEIVSYQTGIMETLARATGGVSWLLWLGGFMLVGHIATRFAMSTRSLAMQYVGLGLFVTAWAVLFSPLLWIANVYAPGVISSAAAVTLTGFTVLTMIVLVTRKDFSFLRALLMFASFAAIGFVVVGSLAGWSGGNIFPILMIALAGGWILHDTSQVLMHYPEDRYVAASLQLFGSVALMFWYVIILFLNSRD